MSIGVRLTIAGFVLVAAGVAVGISVVPTHVTLGAGSIRCGTVLHPDREIEIARYCGPAGAHHLHAVLERAAVLASIALVPLVIARFRPNAPPWVWVAWSVVMLLATVAGVASMGLVEYVPARFLDG